MSSLSKLFHDMILLPFSTTFISFTYQKQAAKVRNHDHMIMLSTWIAILWLCGVCDSHNFEDRM